MLFILASVLLTLGFVSAMTAVCATLNKLLLAGTIYQDAITENGCCWSNVDVTCNEAKHYITTSVANGAYSVKFDCNVCDYGDAVTVHAT